MATTHRFLISGAEASRRHEIPWRDPSTPPCISSFVTNMEDTDQQDSASADRPSNITGVTQLSNQYVHPDIYAKMTELQKCFDGITTALIENNSSPAVSLPTKNQVVAACKKPRKDTIVDMFAKLYDASRQLCASYYLPRSEDKQTYSQDSSLIQAMQDMQMKSDAKFQCLQEQLVKVTSAMQSNTNTEERQSIQNMPAPRSEWKLPVPEKSRPAPNHQQKHLEDVIPDFLIGDNYDKVKEFLDAQTFSNEGERQVIQFGAHYQYMGSKTEVQPIPGLLQDVLDSLNTKYNLSGENGLNSILINKLEGPGSSLAEHSDNEFSINPESSIYTLTVGDERSITFKNIFDGTEVTHNTAPGSLYIMSRDSQALFRHRIDKDSGFINKVRYSITFRCIHYHFLNSTVLIGDSNTRPVIFGKGKGTVGEASPGRRIESIHIEDINPEDCASYRNVVLMVGTNNIKKNTVKTDSDVQNLVEIYRDKIVDMRRVNPRCNVFIVPVIPCKSDIINRKIGYFNQLVCNELVQHFSRLFVVEGTQNLADPYSYQLADRYSKKPDASGLHLNEKGISVLVTMIKSSIFRSKSIGMSGKVHNSRLYSSALSTEPRVPVDR